MIPDPSDYLPLHPLAFEILVVLLDGETHAYSIVKQLEARSQGGQQVLPANLYRRLRDMLDRELLEEVPVPGGDRRKRDFRITPLGRRVVTAEAIRLESAVTLARAKGLLGNA